MSKLRFWAWTVAAFVLAAAFVAGPVPNAVAGVLGLYDAPRPALAVLALPLNVLGVEEDPGRILR